MSEPAVSLLSIEQIFSENSCNSKLKLIGEFQHALGIIEKPSMS
jgi:hypothetical protein